MSFPAYDSYRDSGLEWLGQVPSHWGGEKLRYIASFIGGGTPSRDEQEFWGGDIPWVSPKDMKSDRIEGAQERITPAGLAASSSRLVEPGAVLMVVRSGILQHTIPVAQNVVPVALNQDMKALRFDDRCHPSFFVRWVQGLNDQLRLAWAKQGATVESIEHSYLADCVIPLPPPAEQRAIAAFLDRETAKIDALVEAQRRLIELLKEKRQAVISHAVTKGLDPAVPMKDSGVEWLGEVPAHWEVVAFRQIVARLESGTSVNATDTPAAGDEPAVLKTSCVYSGDFDPGENKVVVEAEIDRLACPVRAGTLIVSRMNTPGLVGAAGLVREDADNLYLPDRLWQIHLHRAVPAFVHLWTQTAFYRAQVRAVCAGTSSSMQNLSQGELLSFKVPLPPYPEQGRLVESLDRQAESISSLMAEAQSAAALLLERRAALISAAVTGKIDVRGLVPEQAEAA